MVKRELVRMDAAKVHVLYLSYDGLTDPLGQSQILPYLSGLSKEYAITIVSFEKKNRLTEKRKFIEDICYKDGLSWVPLIYHKNPPVLSSIYDLWRLKKTAKSLQQKYDFKIIHCRSYITSLIGLWMKRKYSIRFIFDMRGFWADERVEGGLWNLNNPLFKSIYKFFKKKELEFLTDADQIISLTHNAKQEIMSWNVASVPINVIPCCVDMELFNPERISKTQKESMRTDLGIDPNEFVLLYLGSLGTWYMVKEMLDFFIELKKLQSNARFLFITPDRLDVSNYPHRTAVIVRRAERNQIPGFISLSQASIIFIKPSFSKKASSATKMGEILAMGVPVIANNNWGDVQSLQNGNYGVLINSFTATEYHNVTLELLKNATNPEKTRKFARQNFSLTLGNDAYRSVYERLVIRNKFKTN